MVEDDDETQWHDSAVLTRIRPKELAETVVFAVLWPPVFVMMRTSQWVYERFKARK